MSINQIQNKIKELDGGAFQKLADAYLYKRGYEHINPLGSVIGTNKVRQGTPDTLIVLPNGKYTFAEHTTYQENNVFSKLKSDLDKCIDESKTGVPIEKIEEVVFCHNSNLSVQEENELAKECQDHGINLNTFGIGPLSHDLYQKYPGLARDFLGVEVDTGQIILPDEFVAAYNKNKLATRLDTNFYFREQEVEEILQGLESSDLLIVSGRSGVGKSRLALECCEQFREAHPEYRIQCIFNRGPDLFEDLLTHFSGPGHYLILVDDANRMSRFPYIVQLLQYQRDDQQIKVIATVRDYALNKVQEAARPHGVGAEVTLRAFDEEQIKQFIEDEYEIQNHIFLERIADISRGNPRLAVMAAEVAKQQGTLQSIGDASNLYEEYFASIREDLDGLGEQDVLKVAGILTFFQAVDRSNKEMMESIEEAFGITSEAFWEASNWLHDLEVLDMYEDEVVRTSDQVLATYLFYLAFFRERVLDFGVLLDRFFPSHRHRLIDAINPVVNVFSSQAVTDMIRAQVDKTWQRREKAGDEEGLLHIMDAFGPFKETDTLLHLRNCISDMEAEEVELSDLRIGTNSNVPSPSILSILGSFGNSDEDTLRVALRLLLDYLAKRPNDLPLVLRLLAEQFGFEYTSYLQGFVVQRTVIDVLWERARDGNEELFAKLFLAVAKKYLGTHFSSHRPKGSHSIQITSFDLPPTSELDQLRHEIWNGLFLLYKVQGLQREVLNVLQSYSRFAYGATADEIVAQDALVLLPFVESELSTDHYRHCSVVHSYLDLLDERNVEFDSELRNRFRSEIYALLELLLRDRMERRHLDLDYEEYEQYRKRRIDEYFANYDYGDYERFIEYCLELQVELDQDEELQFRGGVASVFLALAEREPALCSRVLERYLELGEQLRVRSSRLVEKLVEICGANHSYEILIKHSYPTKRSWLFHYHESLPQEDITAEQLNQLYALYREAQNRELPYSFDFLLKYRLLDENVVAHVAKIIVEKVEADGNYASALSGLFNPHTETNKMITQLFADHLDLLKRAYFVALRSYEHEDYNRSTLARILDLDPDFITEYIDYLYGGHELVNERDDTRDYNFLWLRDDYEKLLLRVAELIYEKEREQPIFWGTGLDAFFRLPGENGEDEFEIKKKQDHFLGTFIAHRHNDPDFMELVFKVIAEFTPDRRRSFINLFVKHNQNFEDFQRLSLRPSHWSSMGSGVPALQERVEYLESLLPVLNTADLLQHKQSIEQCIEGDRSWIEREKKKDFMRD